MATLADLTKLAKPLGQKENRSMTCRHIPISGRFIAALLVFAPLTLAPRSAGAVVAGSPADATIGQSIVMVLTEGGGVCSGIVLAPQIVLTAGHCLQKGKAVRVYAPPPDAPAGTPHLIAPSASAVHPAYAANAAGTRRRSVDLALLRLPEALPPPFAAARIAASPAPERRSSSRATGLPTRRSRIPRASRVRRS
jgi:hypothetical protein